MISITKFVLRRPVTTLLCILSLVFFGAISLTQSKLELTPEINMPMLVVTTTYPGSNPEDVDRLITRELEDSVGTLSGVDKITGMSSENYSMLLLQYDYGTDMDNAYTELRKRLDLARNSLPDDVNDPTIIEMDVNQMASMYVVVRNPGVNNVYNYTEKNVVPELEKSASIASVSVYGGQKEYIRVMLDSEKLSQLHLDMNTVAQVVGAASFSMPGGKTGVGNTDMNISTGVEYKTPEELKRIPITYGNGNIIYLEDIASVSRTEEELSSIGRYNGDDAIVLAISRNQKYTAANVSKAAHRAFDRLHAEDPNLEFVVVSDSADSINSSLKTVFETMILAIIISTFVLFLFYGDMKGSLIVATSIPISILTALIMMKVKGYSLNVVTMSSLVLAVGMMVDNSIVVLESCFRAMEYDQDQSFKGYISTAVKGTEGVVSSILGGTITTCVVFLPLGFLEGLSGQFFQPLGMTIVFSMAASLLSATSIVPLCFVFYKPKEKEKAPAYDLVRRMQDEYRKLEHRILNNKKKAVAVTLLFFVLSVFLATQLGATLMPEMDQGQIQVGITLKPSLNIEKQDEIYRRIEAVVMADEDVRDYMLSGSGGASGMMGGGGSSITVYLKKDRRKTTKETAELWKRQLQYIEDCDIEVSAYSMTSTMSMETNFQVTLVDADYDELKTVSDQIYKSLQSDNRLTAVSSSLANAAPLIKFRIDPVAAAAEGFSPAQVSSNIYTMLTGKEADKMDVDGETLSIKVEYPRDEFDDINKVKDIRLTNASGNTVCLTDIADVYFEDSPSSITRADKQYQAVISASYTDLADGSTKKDIHDRFVAPMLKGGVEEAVSSSMESMNQEFSNLFTAILIAIFLVFVVMAAQFESPRFSFMVMTTIPFAMVGSFGLLWLFDIKLSMPTLIGYLMLIGTVVNNGILYVDTVNELRNEMDLETAIVEAGVIRLRPILMTTLTTIMSMFPLGLGVGEAGPLMQGLALVNIGGLFTSTLMALLVLPVYYYYMNGKKKKAAV